MTERQWSSLPAAVKRVWLLRSLGMDLGGMALCAIAAVVCRIVGWWSFWHGLVLGVIVALLLAELITQPLQTRYSYAFNRYSIGEHDVMLKKGWLLRTTTTIPYNRVQHVETKQGPLLRRFGLTAVEIHTAVDEHEITALDDAQATSIVEQISARVLASKDDV
ncbi:Bacterial PH domain-containing protein [Bifidobacterium margollesii]|uniref:Bacterial PH domain-containing protein n=1 Tax=Bifidobacterium margollesii TaxID=2020964 RepID=A0A2N5J8I9_9BIFI|nr:PH domain-containing protein [Bifidobacterium margollesii]PLS30533.1 Bacterial PH domain-containing protein [Bifidobacterium margollesii]